MGGVTGEIDAEGECGSSYLGTEEVPSLTGKQEPHRRLLEHPREQLAGCSPSVPGDRRDQQQESVITFGH